MVRLHQKLRSGVNEINRNLLGILIDAINRKLKVILGKCF